MNFTTEVFTGSATVFIFRNKIPRTLLFFFCAFAFFCFFLLFRRFCAGYGALTKLGVVVWFPYHTTVRP